MHALLIAALLAQPQPPSTGEVTIAIPGLSFIDVEPKLGAFWTEHVSQQLKLRGVKTITQREISALLGAERQRQLLGCSEAESACSIEIANALGTDGILIGDIARTGDRFQINLKILSAKNGRTLALYADRASADEMIDTLSTAGKELSAALGKELKVSLVAIKREDTALRAVERRWWVPAAAGAAVGVAGAVFLVLSNQASDRLRTAGPSAPLSSAEAIGLRDRGSTFQLLGGVMVAIGATALATGAALFIAGRIDASHEIAFAPIPGGAAFSFGATW
jgi:hypothetical protein